MKIEYSLSIINKDTIKECDKGRKALQSLLVITAWKLNKLTAPIMWIATRFFTKIVTQKSVSYNFYMIDEKQTINQLTL